MTRDFSPGKVVFRRNPVGSQGKSTRHGGKDLSDSVSTVFRYTQRCVQKGNRPCAQRHTRTDSKACLPPSAGFTAFATCCLWNASDSILKYLTKVNTQISFYLIFCRKPGGAKRSPKIRSASRCSSSRRGPWWRQRRRSGYTGPLLRPAWRCRWRP